MPSIVGIASVGATAILAVAAQSGAASAATVHGNHGRHHGLHGRHHSAHARKTDPPAPAASCVGPGAISRVSYVLTGPTGSRTVERLHGNVRWGDTVTANFSTSPDCAGTIFTLAAYTSTQPWQNLAAQMLYNFQTVTCNAQSCSLTARIPVGPPAPATLSISGTMEGDMAVIPGSTIQGGFSFTQRGNHPANSVGVNNASVSLTVNCPGNNTEQLVIPIPDSSFAVAADNSDWHPSGDPSSPLTWQGQITVPGTTCGGQVGHAPGGATFTADFSSTVPGVSTDVRFHYRNVGGSGSWSSTAAVVPPSAPHWQIDFATGPVVTGPPKFGPDLIDASTDAVAPSP
jgi:hypothetical protein